MKTSKLTKNDLKGIVKECLIEILAEGLSSHGRTRNLKEQISHSGKRQPKRRSYIDKVTKGIGANSDLRKNPNFDKKVDKVVGNLTNDPIMSEMLADTAKTTLQEQNSAESAKGASVLTSVRGDSSQQVVSQNSPEELFGSETANKWAQLAFPE